jgi:N-acetylglucosamine transport system substrate-binding protein
MIDRTETSDAEGTASPEPAAPAPMSGGAALAAAAGIALLAASSGCRIERPRPHGEITLEVAIFEGGYGLDWHRAMAREYEKVNPNIRIHLWGDPRVDEKIKPRILRRNPPDLASCNLPIWKLIVADKLYPLNSALDSPAYGQPGTLRETLVAGVLNDFVYDGKTYSLPSNLGSWVCWYDKRQFRKNGWSVPRTWSEFMALCAKVKASGVAPLAYQGKYPSYAWSTLLALYQRLVPFDRWYAMQDMKPGAFMDPGFIRAADLMQQMAVKYFQSGALAMTHTESQMEWVNGRAAMVFCGLWLKNEMKNALPNTFEMGCFAVPPVEGGAGDPRAIYAGGGENFAVFADAPHPKEAADFLKFLLSINSARDYVRRLDTLSPVKNCAKGVRISSALQDAVAILDRSTRLYSDRTSTLYLDFTKNAVQQGLADLVAGKVKPADFGRRMEQGAEEVRRNSEIYKPPARGVPPV